MSAPGTRPFHFDDPLPGGRLAVEASAGTGKTYALAALATRFIAEDGLAASELLIVTFTRAATSELRARVRDRLVEAEAHLAGRSPAAPDDETLAYLARTDRRERRDRQQRLQRAITEFDAASVSTIHGFASQVLGTLGAQAGVDPDASLADDQDDLVAESCADVLAWAATSGAAAGELPSMNRLEKAAGTLLRVPDLVLAPAADQPGARPAELLLPRLVDRGVEAVAARRRAEGSLSFDDLLVRLRTALTGPGAAAALASLRQRFKVALIDEFQDTDPVQWAIFSTLFGAPADCPLVLVGDPKQAIYSFRGADVHTYLRAVTEDSAVDRRSLGTNWRSDGAVVRALDALLSGSVFGDRRIAFAPVRAAERN